MKKRKVGELISIEPAPHTWADYRANIYFYPVETPHGIEPGFFRPYDFIGYSKRGMVDRLRAEGIICPRSICGG